MRRLEKPKTPKRRRTLPISKSIVSDLAEHKVKQAGQKVKVKENSFKEHGFVFTANNGEPLDEAKVNWRYFKKILKSSGLPDIRLYDLRHTCATLLLKSGTNPKLVSELLGHSCIALTLDTYSHVLPGMLNDTAEVMESLLFDEAE